MTKEEFHEWYDPVFQAVSVTIIRNKVNFQITNGQRTLREEPILCNSFEDAGLNNFSTYVDGWSLFWKTKEATGIDAEGAFHFLEPERILNDAWDESFGGNDWAPETKGFRPVDFFYDSNGMAGLFAGRNDRKGFYLLKPDNTLEALHVDFNGYLQLLKMSRGYGWWQNALVEISTGAHQPNTDGFRADMPKLFPDFSWEKFVELYQSVRIDK